VGKLQINKSFSTKFAMRRHQGVARVGNMRSFFDDFRQILCCQ